jgi:xeroderma pigmentosum group C-complementing protein
VASSDVPDVFQDLLADATSSQSAGIDEDNRPLKKRKTAASRPPKEAVDVEDQTPQPSQRDSKIVSPAPASISVGSDDENGGGPVLQTIQDSDESDESDFEWEDALADSNAEEVEEKEAGLEVGDLSITIEEHGLKEKDHKKRVRRRGITSIDKKRRLDTHKLHILCLLYHVHRRNAWCNDGKVQAILRKLPSPATLSNLVPNPEFTQFQASKRFLDGMKDLSLLWSKRFSVTALGMRKPRWSDNDAEVQEFSTFDDLDMPMDREDFRKAATILAGSQDVGAQLFCALLRAIGVETRLVCSLQVLPFASTAQPSTPQKEAPSQNTIHLDPFNKGSAVPYKLPSLPRPKKRSRLERVLGERITSISSGVSPKQPKKYHSSYPVYWVEVFNPAHQKWVPIDPHCTNSVDKPDKLEPPLNFTQNSLHYAVAFEDDCTAKDVTRRYAKAYNAKTRKFRVESTEGGAKWWKKALKMFRRRTPLDRDQVEDAALARKEAAEGMPKNVQDFKDHPVYVLERHLKHNEVIHPMHQVGKVNVGSAMNPKMEPIYRRKDVHVVRSADKWYRLGRDVKGGEQPLKHAKPKKAGRRSLPPDADIDEQGEEIGAGLYALFQTEIYVPPPVVNGRVPRNAFGNLDLYVPSMVPPGGAHIPHKLAAKAARIVGVDSANAVTGFSFKGRHGTAIVQGVVVAQEYKEAVEAVIDAMEYAQQEAEESLRRDETLRMWRRFLIGLQVAQRVNAIEIDGEYGPSINMQEEIEKHDKMITEQQLAGGFFMDERAAAEPTSGSMGHKDTGFGGGFVPEAHQDNGTFIPKDDNGGGGFMTEGTSNTGSFMPENTNDARGLTPDAQDAGGFVPEDSNEGGGYLPEQPTDEGRSPAEPYVTPGDGIESDIGGSFILEDNPTTDEDGDADNLAGGFVPGDEPVEEVIARSTTETTVTQTHGGDTGPSQDFNPAPTETGQGAAVDEPEFVAKPPPIITNADGKSVHAASQSSPVPPPASSPSEAGSLPLEDPDDEDADPDWLVDVT